ncbi:MAG: tRNA pseudouridine(55) synthase TruB [Angelakisella sp.]
MQITSGIICVDKPEGFTSFDVVAKARGITGCRKIGHGGTLDPMATGVLPLFLGRATKVMDIMPTEDKRYTASFRLGLTTDTQDSTGTVLSESPMAVTREMLEQALQPLRGEICQLPPMYSAVQVNGRRLYDLAREGKEVERPTRQVTIHALNLLCYDADTREGMLDIACSKGTYVRTILHDVGQALGCGGVMTALRRTETLGYPLSCCCTLEQLQVLADAGRLGEVLLPPQTAFEPYPKVRLDEKQAKMFLNGVRLDTGRLRCPPAHGRVTVWQDTQFLGVARIDPDAKELIMEKLFQLSHNNT